MSIKCRLSEAQQMNSKAKEELSLQVELRQNKYLNNMVEQDHRAIKRLVKPGMSSARFNTAKTKH